MKPRNVTSADVARLAGVSRATVSRSFSADPRISEPTRQKVLRAAAELGYQVDKIARAMITRKSDLVGLVGAGLLDPFRTAFLNHLIIAIQRQGFRALLHDTTEPGPFETSLQDLLQYQVCGIIVTSGTPPPAIGQAFMRRNVPVVLVNRAGRLAGADLVNCDNDTGARLAAETFVAAGYRDLAFLGPEHDTYSGRRRAAAFQAALAPHLADQTVRLRHLPCPGADYTAGYDAGMTILHQADPPRAVFCAKDHIACGFLDAARHGLGKTVPDDVAVIGFDDIAMAGQRAYGLTTIRQCPKALAEATAARMRRRLDTPDTAPARDIVPVTLVRRRTA